MNKTVLKTNLERALKGEVVAPRKRTTSSWQNALKEFNQGKPMFLIPRKGSQEYDRVTQIMAGRKAEANQQSTQRKEKPIEIDAMSEPEEVIRPKMRRPRRREEVVPESQKAQGKKNNRF